MNTLIPLEYYNQTYYYFLIAVVAVVFFQSRKNKIKDRSNLTFFNFFGLIVFVIIVLYLGLRPINGHYFGDMRTYATTFDKYAAGEKVDFGKDIYFEYFMKLCSSFMTVEVFFIVCAVIYVLPLYLVSKKIFKAYWFYAFLMLVASITFWDYGTNGIRNGLATSLFLLAITRSNKASILALLFVAVLCHKSVIIPTIAFGISFVYKKTRWLLFFWFLAIPLSLALGGFWENFFLKFGFGEEERLQEYLVTDEDYLEIFSHTGFRWDFLLYSASAVFAGWFYIYKKKYNDKYYTQLYNIFLIVNAFWVLVIRANFSNRFAYLSWFMMGLIIIYPLLKNQFYQKQHEIIGKLIVVYFIVTFFLNVVFANEK